MKPISRPLVIGVAGIMGAGKSTVTKVFEEMGAKVIDADRMGKEMLKDPRMRDRVINAFGEGVRGANGEIDTAALGRTAFAGEDNSRKLDEITGAALVARIKARIEELRATSPVIVVDAALLPEWDARPWLDVVVVVDCDERRSVERLLAGSKMDEANVRLRMEHQMSRQEKAGYADVLIPNHGSLEELRQRARAVFRALVEPGVGGVT